MRRDQLGYRSFVNSLRNMVFCLSLTIFKLVVVEAVITLALKNQELCLMS